MMKLLTAAAAGLCLASATGTQADEQRPKIGVAVPYFGSAFWVAGLYGVETEAQSRGFDIIKKDAGDSGATQIDQVEAFLADDVSAIIIGAADSKALGPVVDKAMQRGVPVVALSTPPAAEKLTSFVGADNIGMGRLQAICLGRALDGKGKVAVLAGPAEIWAELRVRGFVQTMEADFPDIEIVANLTGGADTAADNIASVLAENPDISGVFTAMDTVAVEALNVLSDKGLAGKVAVSTTNLNQDAQTAMERGDLACASLQPPVNMGKAAVEEVARVLDGRETLGRVQARTYLVTQDKIGSFDFSDMVAPGDYKP